MKLGIIGLPGAGKTTIFNALTRGDAPTGRSMGGRFDVLSAIVNVPDERVDTLSAMYKPKKTTYARVTYADTAGLQKGIGESGGLSGPLLNHLAALDGYVHVVRAFESDLYPHADGSVDAQRDLASLDLELLLNDLVTVEGKLERLADGLRKGALKDKVAAQIEQALFTRLHDHLSTEAPLRTLTLEADEEKALRGYGLLTLKPVLIIFNTGDEQADIVTEAAEEATRALSLRGKLEAELALMAGEDLDMFMEEYGVAELGLDRVISESYELMGLQSFFTVGEDEVRAWTIKRGTIAVNAAGTIHSDLSKGFIRAETVAYNDLTTLGSMAEARNKGKLRQEGKTYVMADGDVINVKFNL